MNENDEVVSVLPQNYKLLKQWNIPWLKLIETAVVVVPLMYFLWTINFTMTIKFLGTILIGLPLFIILLIGHRGKSIGQVIILSLLFSKSKIQMHLRSVNDERPKTIASIVPNTFGDIAEKTKNILHKFVP